MCMLKNAWPALLAASLWAVAPAPSQAQGANNKPAPQKPASVGAARPAVPTAAANSEVVGYPVRPGQQGPVYHYPRAGIGGAPPAADTVGTHGSTAYAGGGGA